MVPKPLLENMAAMEDFLAGGVGAPWTAFADGTRGPPVVEYLRLFVC